MERVTHAVANIFPLVLLSFIFCSTLAAQEPVSIPFGPAPIVDGSMSDPGWSNGAILTIGSGASPDVTVRVLHDGTHLYLAFAGPLSSSFLFPEVLIDPDNGKTAEWNADDWWFHVSGTDCASEGAPNDFADCESDHPDWHGVPNFTPESSPDTVEIVIPFEKIGVGPSLPHTLGATVDVTNTATTWIYWPASAATDSPASWGTWILQPDQSLSVDANRSSGTERPSKADLE